MLQGHFSPGGSARSGSGRIDDYPVSAVLGMSRCGYLPPQRHPFDRMVEDCPMQAGHDGPHLASTPGRAFQWSYDDDCDCCDVAESDRCFTYSEVAKP